MMSQPEWDAQSYQTHAAFVPVLASDVLALLNPQAHERILDLGCGDGTLTAQLQHVGCTVIGVDASPDMVAAARRRGLEAYVQDACALDFHEQFDAVFSNAALHWMVQPEQVVRGVHAALKPGGRFVAEFGGAGNIAALVGAMEGVFRQHPDWGGFVNPWYFPEPDEYQQLLEQAGFTVRHIQLIPRPTPLASGIGKWLEIFAEGITHALPPAQKAAFLQEVAARLKPTLYSEGQGWVADYVRLRIDAAKPHFGPL
ncbi:MAG: methyltransferase domain-containing protein [Methylovulum miyakonense]|uniref:class I SAM-dependent methyltransferase n=1 Tax=Methylovulum miyakonense TaxID=645578 RepID=UPI003BB7DACB